MDSEYPKAMQEVAGQPLLSFIMPRLRGAKVDQIHVVVAPDAEKPLKSFYDEAGVNWVVQRKPLGTGHAVKAAIGNVLADAAVVVLYVDNPMIGVETIVELLERAGKDQLALLTTSFQYPRTGYGRIVRDEDDRITGIVEAADASPDELKISECNIGPLAAPARRLRNWVNHLTNDNEQGEYYLTEVVKFAARDNVEITAAHPEFGIEAMGINNRAEQSLVEREYQRLSAYAMMDLGLQIIDPSRFDMRGTISVGNDCLVDINVVIEGEVVLENDVEIGANCVIRNSVLKDGTVVHPYSIIENSAVGPYAQIGPFAHLRGGSIVGQDSVIGNFVEVNRSVVGNSTNAKHLTYIGDSEIGDDVNVGAGVITCNYDGASKHMTKIGDGAFIGSNVSLVAPVEIHSDAAVGAGSTISEDVASGKIAVERSSVTTRPFKPKAAKK